MLLNKQLNGKMWKTNEQTTKQQEKETIPSVLFIHLFRWSFSLVLAAKRHLKNIKYIIYILNIKLNSVFLTGTAAEDGFSGDLKSGRLILSSVLVLVGAASF